MNLRDLGLSCYSAPLLVIYRAGILEAPKLDEPLGKEDQWIGSDPCPIQCCLAMAEHWTLCSALSSF